MAKLIIMSMESTYKDSLTNLCVCVCGLKSSSLITTVQLYKPQVMAPLKVFNEHLGALLKLLKHLKQSSP